MTFLSLHAKFHGVDFGLISGTTHLDIQCLQVSIDELVDCLCVGHDTLVGLLQFLLQTLDLRKDWVKSIVSIRSLHACT